MERQALQDLLARFPCSVAMGLLPVLALMVAGLVVALVARSLIHLLLGLWVQQSPLFTSVAVAVVAVSMEPLIRPQAQERVPLGSLRVARLVLVVEVVGPVAVVLRRFGATVGRAVRLMERV